MVQWTGQEPTLAATPPPPKPKPVAAALNGGLQTPSCHAGSNLTSFSSLAEPSSPISSPLSVSVALTSPREVAEIDGTHMESQLDPSLKAFDAANHGQREDLLPTVERLIHVQQQLLLAESVPLQADSTMYLLSRRWHSNWLKFIQQLPASALQQPPARLQMSPAWPGPVDNGDLLDGVGELKSGLIENVNYVLLPTATWQLLTNCHDSVGVVGDGIERNIIMKIPSMNPVVEVYPPNFTILSEQDLQGGWDVTVTLSRAATVGQLKQKVCEKLCITADDKVRLRSSHDRNLPHTEFTIHANLDQAIHATRLVDEPFLLVEQQNVDGSWANDRYCTSLAMGRMPIALPWNGSTSSSDYGFSSNGPIPGAWPSNRISFSPERPRGCPGVAGLRNLGNTCFMNSALQCLSNTRLLTEYFYSGQYRQELNTANPLGMRGEVAIAYAKVIEELWSGVAAPVTPRDFKYTISQFAPQFTGYSQHDSQELTAFLLDGLHEDLNRIIKKPYIEIPDNDGSMSQQEFADRLWELHLARNDSIIVDHFQGQYRSTLVCPECGKVSVTFDPFMYLTLPLPIKKEKKVTFSLFPSDVTVPLSRQSISIPNDLSIQQFKEAIGSRFGVDPSKLVVSEVFQKRHYKEFSDTEMVNDIGPNDQIAVHELNVSGNVDYGDVFGVHVSVVSSSSRFYGSARLDERSDPFMIAVRPRMRMNELLELLIQHCQRLTRFPLREGIDSYLKSSEIPCEDQAAQEPIIRICWRTDNHGSPKEVLEDENGFVDIAPSSFLLLQIRPDVADVVFSAQNDLSGERVLVSNRNSEGCSNLDAVTNLDACFDEFSREERLGVDDAWYCPACKKRQQAHKKLDLWKLPDILVIHLKRFSHSRYHRDKIENLISFPLEGLDMRARIQGPVDGDALYDLYAVSNHFGGLGGGHYTAYAKNHVDQQWYSFDDSIVERTDPASLQHRAAYVLFYKRRTAVKSTSASLFSWNPAQPQAVEPVIPIPVSPHQGLKEQTDGGSVIRNRFIDDEGDEYDDSNNFNKIYSAVTPPIRDYRPVSPSSMDNNVDEMELDLLDGVKDDCGSSSADRLVN